MKKQLPQFPQTASCSYRVRYWPLLCIFLISLNAYGQREAENWYFGDNVGLNFSNGYPKLLSSSAMDTTFGSAVVSNPTSGALMFYTDAEQIWNKNHEVMPNGDSLSGFHFIYQNSLILPVTASSNRFYVVTLGRSDGLVEQTSYPFYCKLSYSIVDMQLDNGLGDVVDTVKNVVLADSLTHRLTAIPHRNQKDYWLIAHNLGDDCFQVFLINEEGISDPTSQCIGSVHGSINGEKDLMQSFGLLKPSPDGNMLAVSFETFTPRPLDLFRFNDATGVISDYIGVKNFYHQLGISFSPDNSKLYLYGVHESDFHNDNRIFLHQFDVSTYDHTTISNSRVVLNSDDSFWVGGLQLGPDGRIYGTVGDNMKTGGEGDDNTIHVINYPNKKGNAANVISQVFNLGEGSRFGRHFPNFVQSIFNGLEAEDFPVIPEGTDPCSVENAVKLFPNPTNDFIQFKVSESCYQPYTLTIYNVLGQLINRIDVGKQKSDRIDIRSFTPGLYFAEVEIGHRIIVRKFVKK